MSALKSRIRLQQAQTEYTRGLITKEAFQKIAEECFAVLGEAGHIVETSDEGTQPGPADLPPVITAPKARKPRATATPKASKASTAPPTVTAEATPNEGNA